MMGEEEIEQKPEQEQEPEPEIIIKKEIKEEPKHQFIKDFFKSTFCLLLVIFAVSALNLGLEIQSFSNVSGIIGNVIILICSLRCLVVLNNRRSSNYDHLTLL